MIDRRVPMDGSYGYGITMERPTQETFTGVGFDELRDFLSRKGTDSSQAAATLDLAEKLALVAIMEAGGGLASRLAADRHTFPGGNFRFRTQGMFRDENENRDRANGITEHMKERMKEDPKYAKAINFLTTGVLRSIDRAYPDKSVSEKSRMLSKGFKYIVAEVCTDPRKPKRKKNKHKKA